MRSEGEGVTAPSRTDQVLIVNGCVVIARVDHKVDRRSDVQVLIEIVEPILEIRVLQIGRSSSTGRKNNKGVTT